MAHRFAEIAFTDTVRQVQQRLGSRAGYAAMDGGDDHNHALTDREATFIATRDSFYMATVSETGWPYVQHRGGPAGFLKVLDARTLGFADFRGNRQYVSVGNLLGDDRVSLILVDYPQRRRLKLLGRVRLVGDDEPETLAALEPDDYRAPVERGFVIHVEAFDWNCPQHITPRYTEAEVRERLASLVDENRALKEAAARHAAATIEGAGRELLGDGPLELVVTGVRQLTPRIRAYELRDPDGSELPVAAAGAHLEVPVVLEDGTTQVRHYSIASGPGRRHAYEIAVLREDEGRGGSRFVHARFGLGRRLRCSMPRNDFELHADARPAVLVAGGIGITPLKAMALELAASDRALELHYAGRSHREMAYLHELRRELGQRLTVHASRDGSRMDVRTIVGNVPKDALIYVCGPARLVDAVEAAAAASRVAPERVRVERFEAAPDPGARPVRVVLRRSGRTLVVPAERSILDAMLEAGVDAPYSCRAGNCRTCAVSVLEGTPLHRDTALAEDERAGGRIMLPCVSRAEGACLTLDA